MASIESISKPFGQHQENVQPIPDFLIYEIVKGQPIYYKGYKDVLNQTKTLEEIKIESKLQAWLKANISAILINFLNKKGYDVMGGEIGLILSKEDKRGADIAIYKSEDLLLDEHFSKEAPEVVIEIDVMADLTNHAAMDYIHVKMEDYLNFGVKKVIWVFTKSKKIMIASSNKPWLTHNWDVDVDVIENVSLNIEKMLNDRMKK